MIFDPECQFILNSDFKGEITFNNKIEQDIYSFVSSDYSKSYQTIISQFPDSRSTLDILYSFVNNNIFYCLPINAIWDSQLTRLFKSLQDLFSMRKMNNKVKKLYSKEQNESYDEYIETLLQKSKKHEPCFPQRNALNIRISKYRIKEEVKLQNKFLKPQHRAHLLHLLNKRDSCRSYEKHNMTMFQLSYILQTSCGFISTGHRTIGSGGAFYPIYIWGYCFDMSNTKLNGSLFYYNVYTDTIEFYKKNHNIREIIKQSVPGHFGALDNASMFLLLVSSLKYSSQKYGEFSYNLALMEAGMIAQNIVLATIELELQSLLICGINEFDFIDLLRLRFPVEFPVLGIAVGKKSRKRV